MDTTQQPTQRCFPERKDSCLRRRSRSHVWPRNTGQSVFLGWCSGPVGSVEQVTGAPSWALETWEEGGCQLERTCCFQELHEATWKNGWGEGEREKSRIGAEMWVKHKWEDMGTTCGTGLGCWKYTCDGWQLWIWSLGVITLVPTFLIE